MIDEPILKKKVKRNKQFPKVFFLTIFSILCLLGVTYAFFEFSKMSQIHSEVVTGDIYMNYRDNGDLTLTHIFPKSKEEGIENDYFEFTVLGKNESKTDVYYAINLMYGNDVPSKTRFKDEDMVFYLTEVIDGGIRINSNMVCDKKIV